MYRALRALNSDLEASDVLEMARENIQRKWDVIEAEREAAEQAECEAEEAAEREAEEAAARTTLATMMGGAGPSAAKILQIIEADDEDDGPVLQILQRLVQWMGASGGGAFTTCPWHDRFSRSDVARLLGCSYITVCNWLDGTTYRPHDYHLTHLEAMMEDYSYSRLRQMLSSRERVSC